LVAVRVGKMVAWKVISKVDQKDTLLAVMMAVVRVESLVDE